MRFSLHLFFIFTNSIIIPSYQPDWWDKIEQPLYDEVDKRHAIQQAYIDNILWPQFKKFKQFQYQQALENQIIIDALIFETFATSDKSPFSSTESLSSLDVTDNESVHSPIQSSSRGKQPFSTWHNLAIFEPQSVQKKYNTRSKNQQIK